MAEQLSLFDLFGSDAAVTQPKKKENKKGGQQHQSTPPIDPIAQAQAEMTSEDEVIAMKEESEASPEILVTEAPIAEGNQKIHDTEIEDTTTIEHPVLTMAGNEEITTDSEEHTTLQDNTDISEDFDDRRMEDNEDQMTVASNQEAVVVIHKKRGRKSFKEIDNEIDLVSIPVDEELFKKQYYPISTVAKWFRVNASLLRFWENEFSILKPRKTRKGDRLFRPEDIKNLQIIYHLLRQRKFTIEGAKKYLKANKQTADVHLQIIQSLNQFKSFLLELKANLGE